MKKLFFILSAAVLFVTLSSFVLTGSPCKKCKSTDTTTTTVVVGQKCPGCNGTGKQLGEKCTTCKGNKTITVTKVGHKCNKCGNVWV